MWLIGGDRTDRSPFGQGDEAMRQFMHQDRAEQKARGNPHHVMLDHRPLGMFRRKPRRQRKRDMHKDDELRVMDTNFDPSNAREFDGLSDHLSPL